MNNRAFCRSLPRIGFFFSFETGACAQGHKKSFSNLGIPDIFAVEHHQMGGGDKRQTFRLMSLTPRALDEAIEKTGW